ncbi:hypothetical protein [Chitinimonas sp. JJ19]|uniref:hypothetical protein n=1 Tax=Chitinimonas sp. JJ19 TaxID=3109352 RepID=UPI0030030AE2
MFGTNSDETLIQLSNTNLNLDPVTVAMGQLVTVKYTLDKGAVFGEAVRVSAAEANGTNDNGTDSAVSATNNAFGVASTALVFSTPVGGQTFFIYDGAKFTNPVKLSGGEIGDNTVIIQLELQSANVVGTLGVTESDFKFGAIKIKKLKEAGFATAGTKVSLGQEFRATTATVNGIQTTTAVPMLESKEALSATVVGNAKIDATTNGADNFATPSTPLYIQVGDQRKSFTQTPASFTDANRTAVIGQVSLNLVAGVNKEDGVAYDFNGSDDIKLTLSGAEAGKLKAFVGAAATGAGIWLSADPLECEAGDSAPTASAAGLRYLAAVNDTAGTITVAINSGSVASNTTQATATYNVCIRSNGTDAVEEVKELGWKPSYEVNWFNPRYIKRNVEHETLAPLVNNGTTLAVPLVYKTDTIAAGYQTFVRIQNTSATAGRVTIQCFRNKGKGYEFDGGTPEVDSVVKTATLLNLLGAYQSTVLAGNKVVEACNFDAQAGNQDFHYVRVTGEFPTMDVVQFSFAPNGTVTQLHTHDFNTRQ